MFLYILFEMNKRTYLHRAAAVGALAASAKLHKFSTLHHNCRHGIHFLLSFACSVIITRKCRRSDDGDGHKEFCPTAVAT